MLAETHVWLIDLTAILVFGVIGWTVYPDLKAPGCRRWTYAAGMALYGVFMAGVVIVILAIVVLLPYMWIRHLITGR